MDKNKATAIIEETFDKAFNKQAFILFAQNLLNDIDMSENKYKEYRGNMIKESFRTHIVQYTRIGKYIDPNGAALDVLAIEVQDENKLDKARTSLRNFVIEHLRNFEKDYALAAFYSKTDNGRNWRFSFVKLEHHTTVTDGKIKQQKEFTPAKRYSFLVGEDERSHTAKRQLLPLLQNVYNNPVIEDIEKAFSIEVVTDEFFGQYKELYLRISEHLNSDSAVKNVLEKAGTDIPRFTKKLLGQIVFLYFLQKKGWLGVPQNDKWGSGQKDFLQSLYTQADNGGKSFFNNYLRFLFYEALASQHGEDNYYTRLDCRIPFLNGGLFEANYDWENFEINLPNTLFRNNEKISKTGDIGTGILDVFDRYNFTIREDEPLEKEVAIDPEMLGKVFENMLEITERKSKGAFYTPREIVHYMCQESLIHFLANALENKVSKTDIEEFVHKGIFYIENDSQVTDKGKETKTYSYKLPESIRQSADEIDKLLTNIKICDPAIGSGAFPVGLLNELVTLQLVLIRHLSDSYLSQKLKIIGLKPEEYDRHPEKYAYRVKRHSIQESIYGVDIDASAIDIARLRLWLSLVVDEEDFENIEALPNLDYKIVCGNSLIGMPENAMRNLNVEKELEDLKETFFAENNESRKKELRLNINTKIRELLDSAGSFANYKIDFDFKLFFSEVWRENSGFDIVIGNPPYVNIYTIPEEQKKIYKNLYTVAYKKYDLYVLFFEKSLKLLRKNGINSLITSNKYFSQPYGEELRKMFLNNRIIEIINFRFNIFNATVDTAITSVQKANPSQFVSILDVKDKLSYYKFLNSNKRLQLNLNFIKNIPEYMFRIEITERDMDLIENIKAKSYLFSDICYINYGCRLVSKYGDKTKKDYIFDEENFAYPKFIEGSDIRKYRINSHRFVDYSPDEHYLSLFIELFESKKLVSKDIVGKDGLSVAFDNIGYYNDHTVINAVKWDLLKNVQYRGIKNEITKNNVDLSSKYSYEELLGVINSSVSAYYFNKLYNIDLHFYPGTFQKMIVPRTSSSILNLINTYILNIDRWNHLIYSFFILVSDTIVYELYFPEEVHAAKKGIIEHLQDLKPIADNMTNEQKLAIINSEFERLYDPYHPVRNRVETIDSVEVVRIIKESLQR